MGLHAAFHLRRASFSPCAYASTLPSLFGHPRHPPSPLLPLLSCSFLPSIPSPHHFLLSRPSTATFSRSMRSTAGIEAPEDIRVDGNCDKLGVPSDNGNWKIKMLYDGECPLCIREVNMLRERNKIYDAIKFVDICADDYAAEDNNGIDFETAMGRIHAIRQSGEVLTNVAAFRALYEEVGLGWVYAITSHQPWARVADTFYDFWAKYRLPITGRPPIAEVVEKRRQKLGLREKGDDCCDDEGRRCVKELHVDKSRL